MITVLYVSLLKPIWQFLSFFSFFLCALSLQKEDIPFSLTSIPITKSLPLSVWSEFCYTLRNINEEIIINHHYLTFRLNSNNTEVNAYYKHNINAYCGSLISHSLSDIVLIKLDGIDFDQVSIPTHPPFISFTELARAQGEPVVSSFGQSIAVMSPFLVVGAPSISQVSVYQHINGDWALRHVLRPYLASDTIEFGTSVAISPILLVVGAPAYGDTYANQGAIFTYSYTFGKWQYRSQLDSPDPQLDGRFGESLSLHLATMIVGAPGYNNDGTANAGAFYIFEFGTSWVQRAMFAPLGNTDARAGKHVSLFSGTAVATSEEGVAYICVDNEGTWGNAQTYDSGVPGNMPVSVSKTAIVLGIPNANKVETLVADDELWTQYSSFSIESHEETYFGTSVSISGSLLVVGAPNQKNLQATRGGLAIFRISESKDEWLSLEQVTPLSTRAPLGTVVATDGLYVVGSTTILSTSNGIILVLSNEPGPVVSAHGRLAAGTDLKTDITIFLVDEDEQPVTTTSKIMASFENDPYSLELLDGDGTTFVFSTIIPSDDLPSTLWLRLYNAQWGEYIFDFITVEVRNFSLPVTGMSVMPASPVTLGETIIYTITFTTTGPIPNFPIFLSFGDTPFPKRATKTDVGYEVELESPQITGDNSLSVYRSSDESWGVLKATVIFDYGDPVYVYVFPNAMVFEETARVFFGFLNIYGIPIKKKFLTTATCDYLSNEEASFDEDNSWYSIVLPLYIPRQEVMLDVKNIDTNVVTQLFMSVSRLDYSAPFELSVGSDLEISVALIGFGGYPVFDGRKLSASFGHRGSYLGEFLERSFLEPCILPFSTGDIFQTEFILVTNSDFGCGMITDSSLNHLSYSTEVLVSNMGTDTFRFFWFDDYFFSMEFSGRLLTTSSSGVFIFEQPREQLYNQVFFARGSTFDTLELFMAQYPMTVDTHKFKLGSEGDVPEKIYFTAALDCSSISSIELEDVWDAQQHEVVTLGDGVSYVTVSYSKSVSWAEPTGENNQTFVILQRSDNEALILSIFTVTFLTNHRGALYSTIFPPRVLWSIDDMASPTTATIGDIQLDIHGVGTYQTIFSDYTIGGTSTPISSALYGGFLIAPTREGDVVAFTQVDQNSHAVDAEYSKFDIYLRFDWMLIQSRSLQISFDGSSFLWAKYGSEIAWFIPIEQSNYYQTFFLHFSGEGYLCADVTGDVYLSAVPDFECLFQMGDDYYLSMLGFGKSIFVINSMQAEMMQNFLTDLFPLATVEMGSVSALNGTYTAVFTEPVVSGFFINASNTPRSDTEVEAIGDALATYISDGGHVLLTYDACVFKNSCGAAMQSAMGITATGVSVSSFSEVSYVGDAQAPMAALLPGRGAAVTLTESQAEVLPDFDTSVVSEIYRGTGASKPFCWINDELEGRLAFVSLAPLDGTEAYTTLNADELQILKVMALWTLELVE
eukprot:gnl/Chilomastix_cuspidata/921.p1 GENE.gnl/Chilomastix_cuspidata/921~~gnl/Chilomastix_cuspidata/921.p1  ORF type:complete len:1470 (-),score=76.34 gnl/Chilomastix_cuspidata/921:213-4538(-)